MLFCVSIFENVDLNIVPALYATLDAYLTFLKVTLAEVIISLEIELKLKFSVLLAEVQRQ